MRTLSHAAILASAIGLFSVGTAAAGPLNTGVDANSNLITPGQTDGYWSGFDATTGKALTAYAVSGFSNYWINQPNAEFLSPNQVNGQAADYGTSANEMINWSQTFTLSANGAASDLMGKFAVDNQLQSIIVTNSKGTFTITPPNGGSYASLTSFDVAAADLAVGNNTITFDTINTAGAGSNPTGLLVEFTQIPEPGSLALLGAGLIALAVRGRRRALV